MLFFRQYSSFATYKVEVLGSQTLADLRDALLCDNDFIFTKELEHPGDQQNLNELAKVIISSRLFNLLIILSVNEVLGSSS